MGERDVFWRLEIMRGDPLDIYLRVFEGNKALGNLKDLTGYTGRMQVRPDWDSETVLLEPVVEIGTFAQVDRNGNAVTCNVHAGATAEMVAKDTMPDFSQAVFDIQLTDAFGRPWTIARGIAVLAKDATR